MAQNRKEILALVTLSIIIGSASKGSAVSAGDVHEQIPINRLGASTNDGTLSYPFERASGDHTLLDTARTSTISGIVTALPWRRSRTVTEVLVSNTVPFALVVVENRRGDYGEVLLHYTSDHWTVIDTMDGLLGCKRMKSDGVPELNAIDFIASSRIKTRHHSLMKQLVRC